MYYAIENKERYPSRHLCSRCAETEPLHTLHVIQRLDSLPEPADENDTPYAMFCDFCNCPLDTSDSADRRVVNVLEMLTPYTSAPITRFEPATLARLNEIAGEINDPTCDRTATTEWSRVALDCDREGIARALALHSQGYVVFVAQDEDGWYFAALQSHSGFDENARPLLIEKPSIHPEKAATARNAATHNTQYVSAAIKA